MSLFDPAWSFSQREHVPGSIERLRSAQVSFVLQRRVLSVVVLNTGAAIQYLSFNLCALMLRIVRLVVPHFAINSCSVFGFEKCAIDMIHVPSFRHGAALPSLFGVANFDTFCNGLLMMIWPSRSAVVLDIDRRDSLVISEVLCQAASEPGLWLADNTKLTCRTHHSPFCREIELTAVVHGSA